MFQGVLTWCQGLCQTLGMKSSVGESNGMGPSLRHCQVLAGVVGVGVFVFGVYVLGRDPLGMFVVAGWAWGLTALHGEAVRYFARRAARKAGEASELDEAA